MAKLVLQLAGETKTFELGDGEALMGRHPECQVQVDSNMVSRRHARVFAQAGSYFLEDLKSGNGTTLNGDRVTTPVALRHGDRIKLGPVQVLFETPAPIPRPAATAIERASTTTQAVPFRLNVATGTDDSPSIMGTIERSGRYGSLEVQPEAKLRAVLEISRTLAGTIDLDAILPKILDTLFEVFPAADRGCVLLQDTVTGQLIPKAIKHRRDSEDDSVKLSRTVLARVMKEKTGILSADAANDARFEASESISNFTIRSMMCVPLLGLDGDPVGVINIDTQNPLRQFKPDDLELLMAVAGQAALTFESTRLALVHVEKEKQDNEMRIAAEVQRALLPDTLPSLPNYQFYASYESAQAVGGDYYDCITLPEGKYCLAFGDVAGKGVPASLVMSRLSSAVQNTLEFVHDPQVAVERINAHMCNKAVEGRFVTFTLIVVDTVKNMMHAVIAGHMSPIIRHADGTLEELPDDVVGVPLAVIDGMSFQVATRPLSAGDTVVIYTDGVSEAMNHASDLYGLEQLKKVIVQAPAEPSEMGRQILTDVKRHAAGRPQNDDITLMVFGRTR